MATVQERVGIVETKLESVSEKIIDLKADVKEMHDCLDNTRDLLATKLEKMQDEYRANSAKFFEHTDKLHEEDIATDKKLAAKIEDLEKFKSKWTMYVMVLLAFGAGTGWIGHVNLPMIFKFLGV